MGSHALRLLLMFQICCTKGARVLNFRKADVQRHVARTGEPRHFKWVQNMVPPVHENCGNTDAEKEVARVLQESAKYTAGAMASKELTNCVNPFAVCPSEHSEVSIDKVANVTLKLCALGKLAKNGNFFAAMDGAVLAKRIDTLEGDVLKEWHELFSRDAGAHVYLGGCGAFAKTYLVPMLTTFGYVGKPYVVMPNVTHYYAAADPKNWEVKAVYDAKPLPNLGEGLVKLIKGLTNEWGKDLPKLSEWEAWGEVRDQLNKDLTFLQNPQVGVVDFSLFVHVIQRKEAQLVVNPSVPVELSASKGCIIDPSSNTVVCFRILDYLTPFTWKRELESRYKASKFDGYAKKFLDAFDCIGDIARSDCENYKDLASITAAMEVSKSLAKAVFIGLEAFPVAYKCTYEAPQLAYKKLTFHQRGSIVGEALAPEAVSRQGAALKDVEFLQDPRGSDELFARWLQKAASSESGTGYMRSFCDCTNCTDKQCVHDILQYEKPSSVDELKADEEYLDLNACATMINEFSTETYMNKNKENADMHNVLWNPELSAFIAVRGFPKMPRGVVGSYMHRDALWRGRSYDCFMKTRYLKCTPEEKQGVYFNYKQHFGTLEVMILYADEYSKDLAAFAEARRHEVILASPKSVWA